MNKSLARFLLGGSILVSALAVTKLWLAFPDAVPRLPQSFWIWLVEVSGSRDGEDLAVLEMSVMFVLSLCTIASVTCIARSILRRST